LARTFRYYEKKRGDRRTGSSKLGSVGEAFLFALFLFFGCVVLAVLLLTLAIPEWRANHQFREHVCVVLDKRLAERHGDDGPLYRPEMQIRYTVDGETYVRWAYDIHNTYSSGREAAQQTLNQFHVDKDNTREYPCWYDPDDPGTVVLVRGFSWWFWLVVIVPVSLIAIGGVGLIYSMRHWGQSAERRAAMAQRPLERELFGTSGDTSSEFPYVPDVAQVTDSPGTRLRYRLPILGSPGWALLGLLLACVFWNGIVSVFVGIAVTGHIGGNPDWFLTLFITPFVAIGLGLAFFFVRQLLVTTGIGPTLVEISDHPLRPGAACQVLVMQSGRLTVNAMTISLVCEEEATYRQGTNTRTETRAVYRDELFRREGFEVHRGMPFEAECDIWVPERAMHSFKADHNEIRWKIVVEGDVAGWPDYQRSFALIVQPGNPGDG